MGRTIRTLSFVVAGLDALDYPSCNASLRDGIAFVRVCKGNKELVRITTSRVCKTPSTTYSGCGNKVAALYFG